MKYLSCVFQGNVDISIKSLKEDGATSISQAKGEACHRNVAVRVLFFFFKKGACDSNVQET